MNYLAHCCLVPDTPGALAGSVLGDIVHGRDLSAWPDDVARAIRLHRLVDSYTDHHPVIVRCRENLQPPYRRYAGILLDVVFDHLLARTFEQWEARPLRPFADQVYAALRTVSGRLDADAQARLGFIMGHDLLAAYRHWSTVERGLRGIAGRLSRDNPLPQAAAVLAPQLPALAEAFAGFYPELKQWAAGQWRELGGSWNGAEVGDVSRRMGTASDSAAE